MSLPSKTLTRARLPLNPKIHQQKRNATLLRRPQTPYSFTQLVTLSDGSTYLQRTSSPAPIYRSTKDTRNHALWNPSLDSLKNIEQDEAGRLRAFRDRFGRGWDLDAGLAEDAPAKGEKVASQGGMEDDSLLDLISGTTGFGTPAPEEVVESAAPVKEKMITIKVDGKLKKVVSFKK
ncbi:hypothetical protein GLAREA_07565 [Glarea lozoyensis ATCC 20868]|uniref:Ribosomal protein bL31m N-terminal domain-containing protein n=1 Tax=Glarea lozoyensis (strain ATCC 20868 / MF5171) TaxID=1116229 RepID=S3D1L3_GLAL2|nr:uncharacterized protein GLAREA_07565 [Glarea lozoyensis ATCC 20868]EPE32432.1 hypothetical protein GLAREA_07565 [Glarea lozoyensis ATCC 20868]